MRCKRRSPHCTCGRASKEDTDWPQIVGLYEVLLRLQPSPVIELNHAVAVSMVDGAARALNLVDSLAARGQVSEYHLLHAARGRFLQQLGRLERGRRRLPHGAGSGHARARAALVGGANCRHRSALRGPDFSQGAPAVALSRACKAMAMSAEPPNTRLMPMSRPMAHAAVPGRPANMMPARNRSTTPLNNIAPQRPDSSRLCSSANRIDSHAFDGQKHGQYQSKRQRARQPAIEAAGCRPRSREWPISKTTRIRVHCASASWRSGRRCR